MPSSMSVGIGQASTGVCNSIPAPLRSLWPRKLSQDMGLGDGDEQGGGRKEVFCGEGG